MRPSVADYLRKALAELVREGEEHPPFSEKKARITADANTIRDMLRRSGYEA